MNQNPPASTSVSTSPTAASSIRTPDQRLRVFVSSTLDELGPERRAAREAIAALRLTPVFFVAGARPYQPSEVYRAYLAQSDIFIGIYWQRYGWVAPSMEISGLEEEYLLSEGKTRLIYVKRPAPEREPRLQQLLDRIRNEHATTYQKFSTSAELHDLLANDLAQLLTDRFTRPSEPPTSLSVIRRWRTATGTTMLVIGLLVGGWFWRSHNARALTDKDTIVLADFDNRTGDAIFDDALKQALSVQLGQSPFLGAPSFGPHTVCWNCAMVRSHSFPETETHANRQMIHPEKIASAAYQGPCGRSPKSTTDSSRSFTMITLIWERQIDQ